MLKADIQFDLISTIFPEQSPDRGWRPRLSLRKKSFSLDTPAETALISKAGTIGVQT